MHDNPYQPPQTEQCRDRLWLLRQSLRVWTVLAWIGAGIVATVVFGGIGLIVYRLLRMIQDLRAM